MKMGKKDNKKKEKKLKTNLQKQQPINNKLIRLIFFLVVIG